MTIPDSNSTVRAVLFDIFGTLIRIDKGYSPFATLIRGLEFATRSERAKAVDFVMRSNLPDLTLAVQCLEREFDREVSPDTLATAQDELAHHLESARLVSDAVEVLTTLRARGYRLGLVTNLATVYTQPVVRFGLATLVDVVVYSWEAGWTKPGPEIFATALSELDASASASIMVGDSLRDDVQGARAAGIRPILLSESIGSQHAETVARLADVLDRCP